MEFEFSQISGSPSEVGKMLKRAIYLLMNKGDVTEDVLQILPLLQRNFQELENLRKQLHPEAQNDTMNQLQELENFQLLTLSKEMDEYMINSLGLDQNLKSKKKIGVRGNYAKYDEETKLHAVKLHTEQGQSFNKISKILKIPVKNISRWCKNGVIRGKGAGRFPLDVEMQKQLANWIRQNFEEGNEIDYGMLKKKAKQFCKVESFKASQGWLVNFLKRKNFMKKYVFKNRLQKYSSQENII